MDTAVMTLSKIPSTRAKARPVISFGSGKGAWKNTESKVKFKASRRATGTQKMPTVLFVSGASDGYFFEEQPAQYPTLTKLVEWKDVFFGVTSGYESMLKLPIRPQSRTKQDFTQMLKVSERYLSSYFAIFRGEGTADCLIEFEQSDLNLNQKHDFDFAKAYIDDDSMDRLARFSILPSGWNLGGGKPMQRDSVDGFKKFISASSKTLNLKNSSIFMTNDGNIQLSWNDDEGGCIELEFSSIQVEYFFESTNNEGDYSYNQLEQLIEKISKIEKKKTTSQAF